MPLGLQATVVMMEGRHRCLLELVERPGFCSAVMSPQRQRAEFSDLSILRYFIRESRTLAKKILIDADPGIADALAIVVALADPSLEVLALTACSGVVSGAQATRNLHYLIGLVDPVRHPRIGQSDQSGDALEQMPAGMPHPQSLNGRFGLGDTEPLVPDLHNRRESARLIVDIVREHPHDVRILTFGPLTNVALAFDLDPELPVLLDGIICLGGSLHSVGDITPSAELNLWCNPQAAHSVLKSPVGKILVPLEVGHSTGLTFEDLDRLSGLIPSTPTGEFLTGLLQYAGRSCRQFLPFEEVSLPAVTALAIASGAATFDTARLAADIEVSGDVTSGTLILDRRRFQHRQANVEVVTSVDSVAVVDYFCRGVRRIAIR